MHSFIIAILFAFLPPSPDCASLREGVFKLEDADGNIHTIIRTKDKQIENVGNRPVVSTYNIKWVSECGYLLYNRQVIEGTDDMPAEIETDTLYNEITEHTNNTHKVISTAKKINMKVESVLTRLDTSLLYRSLTDMPAFNEYYGITNGSGLIGKKYAFAYHQKSSTDSFVLAFEEAYLFHLSSKFMLLDTVFFQMGKEQKIATTNCRYNNIYDREIIALYEGKEEKKEAKIIKAWRLNRDTRKIEPLNTTFVKYKEADLVRFQESE